MSENKSEEKRMAEENMVCERVDQEGNVWRKVYSGGGLHLKNWLEQTIELCGEENVEVEEADSTGLKCFEEGGEKMYRIWVKRSAEIDELT